MGVMTVALFITILLLFRQISSSKLIPGFVVHGYRPSHQFEVLKIDADFRAEIDSKIAELSRTFSALKADLERELNEAMEENAEVERKLRSENIELEAELATKTTELRAQINRTTTFLDLDGWSYLAKTASWYKAFDQKMTFDEAVAYCGSKKSHLVSIHSQDENDFVQKLAKSVTSRDFFWIGLKRNPDKGNVFEWTDGSPVDFTNWRPGEPDSNTHAFVRPST